MQYLATQLYNFLIWFYQFVPNLGLEIIIVTILFKLLVLAFTYKSLKQQKVMQAMNVELQELTKKYANDKATLQLKQMELTKKYNVNPLSGCIPQLLQIFVLIIFYQAIIKFIGTPPVDAAGNIVSTQFLLWDLSVKDSYYILPILAAGLQLLLSFMISPGAQVRDVVSNDSKKKAIQAANKVEEDQAQMASTMQRQMMFLMPIMTGFICLNMPTGVVLYWVISTIFGIFQQVALSGWGRLTNLAFWKKTEIVKEKK